MGNTPMERLVDLARWIYAWQCQQGLKDAQMLRRCPGLGSAKTYRDIRDGKAETYDVERWSAEYLIVKNEIELRENDMKTEEIMTDLSTVVQVRRAALKAMATNGSDRVVIVQGPSGAGKSFALKGLLNLYGSRILAIEALDVWADRPVNLLGAIMERMGFDNPPPGATSRIAKVIEWLRRSRTMIAIDEAQHMGPHCLNTIKALVNQTPGEFLLLSMDTLWTRLESSSYQEARQISTNRLCERVVLDLDVKDIALYIRGRFDAGSKHELIRMASAVHAAAINNGNLSFVRGVCNNVADMMGDDATLTREVLTEAISAESAKRIKRS